MSNNLLNNSSNKVRRILMVDDNEEDREYAKRLLTRDSDFDWRFTETPQGEQGFALAVSGGPFDCILLDYRLRDMDGMEFLNRLRSQPGDGGAASVVVLTGEGDESVAVRAMKLGAQEYLSKRDLNSQLLGRAIEYSISRSKLTAANRESAKMLAESEERYRELVEAVPRIIIWTATAEGVLDFANAHWVEFLGITLDEFNSAMGRSLMNADNGQLFSDAWAAGLISGRSFEIEHRLPQRDEPGLRWYLSRAEPIRNEDGRVVRWIGASTDIEDRKRAAITVLNAERLASRTALQKAGEALRQAETLRDALFKSAGFSSVATDEKGVIQLFGAGTERMLGYSAAEVINKITPADISDPHEASARAEELSHKLGTPIAAGFEALAFKASRGIEDIYELTYIRKDGGRFPAMVSVTTMRDSRGRIIGYFLLGTDNSAQAG